MTFEDIVKPSMHQLTVHPKALDSRSLLSLPDSIRSRISDLETENLRLQKLVAELLLKNQQLRGVPD